MNLFGPPGSVMAALAEHGAATVEELAERTGGRSRMAVYSEVARLIREGRVVPAGGRGCADRYDLGAEDERAAQRWREGP